MIETIVYIMAAKINICRCLFEMMRKYLILYLIVVLMVNSLVETATTPPTNTTTTTTTPTTTTTIPTTTTISPGEPRTVIGETAIGQCLCDLTGNECDINCCCDLDCTDADKATFVCDARSVILDNKMCYQEEIFLFSNSPARTQREDGGLFCIYFDNYQERNFYLDPDFILDIPSFNNYVDRYGSPSVQGPVSVQEPVFTLDSFYKSGDPVYIVYPNNSTGTLVLPSTSVSNECNDQNTIAYLNEVNTECTRVLPSLDSNMCTSTAALSAISYFQNFRVVKTPGLFGYVQNGTFVGVSTTVAPPTTASPPTTAASNTTDNATTTTAPTTTTIASTPGVNPGLVQTLYDNPYTLEINATSMTHLCMQSDGSLQDCAFRDPTAPTFSGGTCSNVVQEVRYFTTTDGTTGITEMHVQFVFRNITAANLPLTQRFSVTYNFVTDTNDTFSKSGNPGYLIGKPILYGTLVITTTPDNVVSKEVVLITDPTLGLSVVRASATGECSTATTSRVPIKFGENMRTGCLIGLSLNSLSQVECERIQRVIVETLEGPNVPSFNNSQWIDNNRYVATFGNTSPLKVGDWVKVIVSNRPLPSLATFDGVDTCRLSVGLHIQFLYAYVGALANPQAKIVGVALLYDTMRNVKFRCVGAFCQDANLSNNQYFEVSQTVSFVDVSQPATKFAGQAPIFIARVPNDFFYPFFYYTSDSPASIYSDKMAQWLFISLVTVFINLRQLLS